MTDPKNPESTNEELDLEQLEDASGGLGAKMNRVTGDGSDQLQNDANQGYYSGGGGGRIAHSDPAKKDKYCPMPDPGDLY